MDDTAKTELVENLARLVEEHKGHDIIALDISSVCSWTDFFLITTTTSQAHVKGLLKHINTFLAVQDVEVIHRRKHFQEEGWVLIDCGFLVIHLMSEEMRRFYELERLWHNGKILYHSSKSS